MPCLFVIMAGFFPRIANLILWIARPTLYMAPFNGNWIWPLLGIIFLPFTTLLYVIMWTPGIGIQGFEWFWLVLAVFLDVSHAVASVQQNRDRIPGYPSSSTTTGM